MSGDGWWCGSYLSGAKSYIMVTRSNWFVKHEVRFYKFNELGLTEMTQGLVQKGISGKKLEFIKESDTSQ